jgi:hypothetical protein
MEIPVNNDGKLPSGEIDAVVHEQTLDVDSHKVTTKHTVGSAKNWDRHVPVWRPSCLVYPSRAR